MMIDAVEEYRKFVESRRDDFGTLPQFLRVPNRLADAAVAALEAALKERDAEIERLEQELADCAGGM